MVSLAPVDLLDHLDQKAQQEHEVPLAKMVKMETLELKDQLDHEYVTVF